MVLHLILTTLAGEETQLTIELQEFDRLQKFESAVLEQLPEKRAALSAVSWILSAVTHKRNLAHLTR